MQCMVVCGFGCLHAVDLELARVKNDPGKIVYLYLFFHSFQKISIFSNALYMFKTSNPIPVVVQEY